MRRTLIGLFGNIFIKRIHRIIFIVWEEILIEMNNLDSCKKGTVDIIHVLNRLWENIDKKRKNCKC